MRNKKEFDCVEMKHQIQEKLWKESGATNIYEYAEYVNKQALQSPLWKRLQEKHPIKS